MNPPGHILSGHIGHTRHSAPAREFGYRMWMLALDIDRIGDLVAASRLFRANRFALLAHHDADHGARDASALRPWVEARLAEAGLAHAGARIHLVAIPRIAGYAFNPISFYFCHDSAGLLRAIIHEVKNTFGGQTAYVLPATPGSDGAIRQHALKRLHVSPFFDMEGGYRFAVRAPDFTTGCGRMSVAIRYGTDGAPRLSAMLRLDLRPYSDGAALGQLARMPASALTVTAAIHYQALRLFLSGARFHRMPKAPDTDIDTNTAPLDHHGALR